MRELDPCCLRSRELKWADAGNPSVAVRSNMSVAVVAHDDGDELYFSSRRLGRSSHNLAFQSSASMVGSSTRRSKRLRSSSSGDVSGGIPVVIKRIDLQSVKKETYMLELDFLSNVSHLKIVPLFGHCLENENQKFLVYKYMPNGDLSRNNVEVDQNMMVESPFPDDFVSLPVV
nr:probable LRR receptor-like serine/threonine-protein kinase At2g16250 [Ipomoea batatas]